MKDAEFVEQLKSDYTKAAISPAERAMLDYSVKLTRAPWTMTGADVEKLRACGLSDAAILDLNIVASYYAFVNRLADGLGVPLEPRWNEPKKGTTDKHR